MLRERLFFWYRTQPVNVGWKRHYCKFQSKVIDITKMSIEESPLMEAKLMEKLDSESDDATGGFIESDEYLAFDRSRKPH
jgi:hypothetical protein